MRLIDADAMIKNLETDYNSFISQGHKKLANAIIDVLIPTVECQPTVEQKHGHWIEELASQHGNAYDGRTWTKYKKYRCSYCRITNGNRRPDYCPHCGAEMIKEVTE